MQPQILTAIESEVAVDEAIEVVALLESDRIGSIAEQRWNSVPMRSKS